MGTEQRTQDRQQTTTGRLEHSLGALNGATCVTWECTTHTTCHMKCYNKIMHIHMHMHEVHAMRRRKHHLHSRLQLGFMMFL